MDFVCFIALYLLPTVAPFFILFADFAQCVSGELKLLSKQKWEREKVHVSSQPHCIYAKSENVYIAVFVRARVEGLDSVCSLCPSSPSSPR